MKAERKYLAHYLDGAFDMTYAATNYVRLGRDLEEFTVELNPDVERKKNILGESSVAHNGYEVSTDAAPFYYDYDDELSQKIMDIALSRSTADACKTSYVEVVLKPGEDGTAPEIVSAWREDVLIIPTSYGGDTSGVQVPFTINYAGNRVKGTFDLASKKFTPDENL
jgi:hypothetical protein